MMREMSVETERPNMVRDYTIRAYCPGWYNAGPKPERGFILLPEIQMEDVVRLKKPHPCGSTDWRVVRVGADIGLKCLGCERRILLSRREVAKKMKGYVRQDGQTLLDD